MHHLLGILVLFCTLLSLSQSKVIFGITYPSTSSNTCTTPFGIPGVCIEILECPELIAKLHEGSNGLRLVHQSKCGFAQERTKVCCLQPQTTTVPVTPSVNATPSVSVTTPILPTPTPNTTQPTVLPDVCGASLPFRIIGGEDAELGAWPWAALLFLEGQSGGSWSCGGSLISKRYVLTAAHCVHPSTVGNRSVTKVRLGEHNLETDVDSRTMPNGDVITADPVQDLLVEEIISHPQFEFNGKTLVNDIALIRLQEPVSFTEWIFPVCLPTPSDIPPLPEERVFVIGWGNLGTFKSSSSILQQLSVPIVGTKNCADKYSKQLGINIPLEEQQHLCAGGEPGKDSCKGDSGGSLQIGNSDGEFVQVGIVSFGYKYCGESGIPGVYTNLKTFMPWVNENLRP